MSRALILDPDILILDDSLSAVDAKTEHLILENLKSERQRARPYYYGPPSVSRRPYRPYSSYGRGRIKGRAITKKYWHKMAGMRPPTVVSNWLRVWKEGT